MHNALRWFLLWTLFPFVIVAADPPPPLVRSVLSTNLPPFGLTGQALFRTANLPYLDWSNIVQQVIDTNAFQPASANLTNWSLISTNALTGKLDSNVWWAAWGSLSTNALTGKLDSNYWFTVWGAIGTNALTAKLDSNWWWTAYGGKVLTNAGAFIASQTGFGTNTTFRSSANTTVPLVISNQVGSTTNTFEAIGTNGITGKSVVITSDGKVGIGTNLPQAVLHVRGTNGPSQYIVQVENPMIAGCTNALSLDTNSQLIVTGSGDILRLNRVNTPLQYWALNVSSTGAKLYASSDHLNPKPIVFDLLTDNGTTISGVNYDWRFNSSSAMTLEGPTGNLLIATNFVGKLGLGTNSPQARLDVIGDNSANILRAGTTNRPTLLVLTTNGYLGIGTNTPQCPLHITGTNGPSQYIVQVENPMVAGQTNALTLGTNDFLGVGVNPVSHIEAPLDQTTSSGKFGSWELQTFAVNNAWYGENIYYNGGFKYRASGKGTLLYASTGTLGVRTVGSGNAGDGAAPVGRLFVANTGGVNIGGGATAGDLGTNEATMVMLPNGNVSVGTNFPQYHLDVIGNNAQDILRAGTTNRPTLLALSTNGVLSVNPGGGLNPVGCYGALMMNATNIVVCAGAASVYTNIAGTGYTTIVTNGFYGDTNGNSSALTNLYAGYYRVQASVSYVGANAGAYEAEVFTNNVSCDLIGWKDTFDTPARLRNGGAAGIIYLPAGCRTSVRIQDGGSGTSIAIQRTSLVIGTP